MIIKSLSRATKSFEALYNYLTRDDDALLNTHNLYSSPYQKEDLIKEFLENAHYLKRARGKNYLYHEIISLNKNNLSLKKQQKILTDLVSKYLSLRASEHLAFTALHKDKEHLHIHLMISSNEMMGQKRVRLSKKDFSNIQKELEQYVNTTYPELGTTTHYQKGKSLTKSKNAEQQREQRTVKPSNKERVQALLKELFELSDSKNSFKNHMATVGIEFYTRGKTVGVIFEGKKYRLKTLGLLEEYEKVVARLEQEKEQQEEKNTKQNFNEKQKTNSNEESTKIKKRREQMRELREKQQQSKGKEQK